MTFLGKILVVTQVIFSLVFMAFAGAVYQREETWKKKTVEVQKKLDDTSKRYEEEAAGREGDKLKLSEDLRKADDRAVKTQADLDATTAEKNDLAKRLETTAIERTNFQSQAELAERVARVRREETEQQLAINRKLIQEQDEQIALIAQLRKQNFDREQIDKARNEKHNLALGELGAAKVAIRKLEDMVRKYHDEAGPEALAEKQLPPPVVDGIVQNTKRDIANGLELVEISLGSDDGLDVGHTLFVSRGAKYLGKIKLVKVTPDKAVGTVVKAAKNGIIEEGDHVSTKL